MNDNELHMYAVALNFTNYLVQNREMLFEINSKMHMRKKCLLLLFTNNLKKGREEGKYNELLNYRQIIKPNYGPSFSSPLIFF